MAEGDLTVLANAKQWLNVSTTNDDALLTRLVSAASQFVQTYLNRTIASAAYVENRTGSGSDTLALANYPCTAVSSLIIATVPVSPSPDGLQAGYVFDDRFIYLIGNAYAASAFPGTAPNRFPKWPPQGVQISYTAGFATTPLDIEQAVLELIALKYSDRQHMGQVSKSIQGEVVSFFMGDMPKGVQTILNNYKKVIPV
ncbi:head-tail connector protein [Paraburkholderia sp.]|uniref:head-tail connector protein n=1 Tax=Paraburkholderia sp. TaxID=1926495 RepID=UPI003C79E672